MHSPNDAQNKLYYTFVKSLIPHLLVDVPDLPHKFAIGSIVDLVMQHQQTTKTNQFLSVTDLIGFTNPRLQKGKDVANVVHKFLS